MTDRAARKDMSLPGIRNRLREGQVLLLDGATGTELNRRGVDTRLPLWSTWALLEAPDTLASIHRDYVRAGADILTANTFRTHRRSLDKARLGHMSRQLTRDAVAIARRAADERDGVLVAGSMAPLEDCYEPGLVPPESTLRSEHRELAGHLHEAGADLLLVETMNTVREALAATEAALETGLPTVAGVVCGLEPYLLSGEPVADATRALSALGPDMIVVNCTPTSGIQTILEEILAHTDLPVGAYGNVGYADPEQGWVNTDAVDPMAYASAAAGWLDVGIRLVGSCCGTGPAHTAALRSLIDGRPATG